MPLRHNSVQQHHVDTRILHGVDRGHFTLCEVNIAQRCPPAGLGLPYHVIPPCAGCCWLTASTQAVSLQRSYTPCVVFYPCPLGLRTGGGESQRLQTALAPPIMRAVDVHTAHPRWSEAGPK